MSIVLKAVGVVVAALVVLVVVALVIGPSDNTDEATSAPAATTTRPPPASTVDPDDLTAAEKQCADNWPTISYIELRRMKADRSIDGIFDWSGGYWVSYAKIMDVC